MTDRIYPQFATHNAHTVAAVIEMAEDRGAFEFQRLHGMGEALHDLVIRRQRGPLPDLRARWARIATCWPTSCAGCWKTAPTAFVNQLVDTDVPPEERRRRSLRAPTGARANESLVPAPELYGAERRNARGWDLHELGPISTRSKRRARPSRAGVAGPADLLAGVSAGGETCSR